MHVFLYTLFFCICYYLLFALSCWSFSPPTNSFSLCSHVVSYVFYHLLLLLLPHKITCSPRFIFYSYDIHTLTLMETLKYISARINTRNHHVPVILRNGHQSSGPASLLCLSLFLLACFKRYVKN